jgi:hypothetical protein
MSRSAQRLIEECHAGRLVRFKRRFESSEIHGYVEDVGPEYFLLSLISDRIRFDGFVCFRISDVSDIRPDPYTEFVEAALDKRAELRPAKPAVNLETLTGLLLTAGDAFPLVTIHHEITHPDICHIGKVLQVNRGSVWLLEISPNATWDSEPYRHTLRDITQINFGGDYEDALQRVGGDSAPDVRGLTLK